MPYDPASEFTGAGLIKPPGRFECDNVPYPVNYQTNGSRAELWESNTDASNGFVLTNLAGHEWVGLFIYRMMGMTDALFPGPRRWPGVGSP